MKGEAVQMDVLAECEVTHEFSGAMAVSVFFLAVFVALLVGDALLTRTALTRTLTRNERLERQKRERLDFLDGEITKRSTELRSIDRAMSDLARGQKTGLSLDRGLRLTPGRPKGAV